MGILRTMSFVLNHPLNKSRKLKSLQRWVTWQVGSRLVPGPVAVPYVNRSRLLVKKGMKGATGNVYTGLHEFEDMSFLLHTLRSGERFVDVGANVGTYTVLAAAVVGAHVVAIEPIPSTFQCLIDNININCVRDLVRPLNVGLGAASGSIHFTASLDAVNHVVSPLERHRGELVECKIETLDSVVDVQRPLLLKVDVEGFESEVFAGGQNVMADRDLKAVIVELNGAGRRYGRDDARIHQMMVEYGFRPVRYLPESRRLLQQAKNNTRGNTIYVRDLEDISARVATADSFIVNGKKI